MHMTADRRDLAGLFRSRLSELVEARPGGLARFAREAGLDRSALSQFLDPDGLRLPRAETLRRIAEASGASVDWMLGITNARQGGQEIASSAEVETVDDAPLARWQREAEGGKIRYVPSSLPDMFRLPTVNAPAVDEGRATARAEHAGALVDDARFRDTDVEICMGLQTLEALAAGQGPWAAIADETRLRQLRHMSREAERLYPAIRVHLYDERHTFSAPFTVFAMKRAAVYLGRSYLVVTGIDQVRALARHFDDLVREAVVAPHVVHDTIARIAEGAARRG